MRNLILFLMAVLVAGCTQAPVVDTSHLVQGLNQDEYSKLIDRNTKKTNQYSGFYQTFQADVTRLTTEVQQASLREKARALQWDMHQFQSEREKMMEESSAYSKFFVRFFSPENDYDDLDKPKSIWKVYLEYAGSRFEGKAVKLKEKPIQLQLLYPYMDRFSTGYEVTFNVPMTTVQQGACKFILTSSLGTAEFSFPASP